MEENKLKSVWVLTYKDSETDRVIFGVYADKDAAKNALNGELLLPGFNQIREQEPNLGIYEVFDLLYDEYDPRITTCKINY